MAKYVWLFPILFMVHDLEELIGLKWWIGKNLDIIQKRFPKIAGKFAGYNTEGMALAVLEEFLLCLAICGCALSLDKTWLWCFWWGTFMAYTIHLVIHIGQSIVLRKYVPCLITSIICLPISIYILAETMSIIDAEIAQMVVYSIIGLAVVGTNLLFAQKLIRVL